MTAPVASMSKKSQQPESSKAAAGQSAKIADDVLRMARLIVADGGAESVTILLSDICRPVLTKMIEDMERRGLLKPR